MTAPAAFSDAYLKFTQVYNQMQVREEDHTIRVPEKVIRCIWNDQLFCTPSLKTQDGQNLEIVYPGYWNFGKGPDFTSATIKVDGKTYEGDVELHVHSTDWNAHGHSSTRTSITLSCMSICGRAEVKALGQKGNTFPSSLKSRIT